MGFIEARGSGFVTKADCERATGGHERYNGEAQFTAEPHCRAIRCDVMGWDAEDAFNRTEGTGNSAADVSQCAFARGVDRGLETGTLGLSDGQGHSVPERNKLHMVNCCYFRARCVREHVSATGLLGLGVVSLFFPPLLVALQPHGVDKKEEGS